MEPRAFHMLGKDSTTDLQPQPWFGCLSLSLFSCFLLFLQQPLIQFNSHEYVGIDNVCSKATLANVGSEVSSVTPPMEPKDSEEP